MDTASYSVWHNISGRGRMNLKDIDGSKDCLTQIDADFVFACKDIAVEFGYNFKEWKGRRGDIEFRRFYFNIGGQRDYVLFVNVGKQTRIQHSKDHTVDVIMECRLQEAIDRYVKSRNKWAELCQEKIDNEETSHLCRKPATIMADIDEIIKASYEDESGGMVSWQDITTIINELNHSFVTAIKDVGGTLEDVTGRSVYVIMKNERMTDIVFDSEEKATKFLDKEDPEFTKGFGLNVAVVR